MARTRKRNLHIPDVVGEQYRALSEWDSRHARRSYIAALHHAGWTLKSIADIAGMTRESIRLQYAAAGDAAESLDEYRLITGLELPIPPLPTYPEKPKRVVRQIPDDVAVVLQNLHARAIRYRGTENNRENAVAFTALVWSLHTDQGYSIYQIAKATGVTHTALQFRLVRYGYKTTTGTSEPYRRLTGRLQGEAGRKKQCKRGHEFSPENTYILKNGNRICKACQSMRAKAYNERKKNAAHH